MRLPDPDRSHAVLIGTSRYEADSGFTSFRSIERSLDDFADFLSTTTGLRKITKVLDPRDGLTIAAAISAAAETTTDLLLFYYVGHGVAVNNQLHLTHATSRADEADVTTLAYPVIRARIKSRSRAKVNIVILDCCHSGKAFGHDVLSPGSDVLREATDIEGAFVLTATDAKTKFAVATDRDEPTAFTGRLLDILRTGIPSNDRFLTMSVLYRELRDRLSSANLPKPKALEHGTAADLALAVNALCADGGPPVELPDTGAAAYFAQVRDIAPEALLDREPELTELAAFCAGDEPYVWWRAGPWAGKTALLSWFALHPPERVRVVCFFITSRLAAQADHAAFTDAVLDQLLVLLPEEQATIAAATVGNRDAVRRHLLDVAAKRAIECDQRIVLIVDGLDEDQGAPSIASLLPKIPGPGLRVIVASRPNPPVPLDVPDKHPLYTCRRRELIRSQFSDSIQHAAQLELHGMLRGPEETRHVLGLVTAAGGLTNPELEDLTHLPPFRINDLLGGVTGRTFRTRVSAFVPNQIYLLAHEQLQQEAEKALGHKLLGVYREEIHAWADRYRELGWPDTTPTYLSTRYFSMLKTHCDLPRMTALALDRAHHDRLLHLTGGDISALTEVAAVQERILEKDAPDALAMCKLAIRRERLSLRSANIPVELPYLFAVLGEHDRAANLVRSIPYPDRRAAAQIKLMTLPRNPIDHERDRMVAVSLIGQVESFADRDGLEADLTLALLSTADVENAKNMADGIVDGARRLEVLAELVCAYVTLGRVDDANACAAEAISAERFEQHRNHRTGMASLAVVHAALGAYDRAEKLLRQINGSPVLVAQIRVRIARIMRQAGHFDRARAVLPVPGKRQHGSRLTTITAAIMPELLAQDRRGEAQRLVERLTGQWNHARDNEKPAELISCLADLGELDRAVATVNQIGSGASRFGSLAVLIPALAAAGRESEARSLVEYVEALTQQSGSPQENARGAAPLAVALAMMNDLSRAEQLARVADPHDRADVFAELAALAAAHDVEAARRFAEESRAAIYAALPWTRSGESGPVDQLRPVAESDLHYWMFDTGEIGRLAWALRSLAAGFTRIGDNNRVAEATEVIELIAEEMARYGSLTDEPPSQAIRALIDVGLPERAIGFLGEMIFLHPEAAHQVLIECGPALCAAGVGAAARDLLEREKGWPDRAYAQRRLELGSARAALGLGVIEPARKLASGRADLFDPLSAEIAVALVRSGELTEAIAVTAAIEQPEYRVPALISLALGFAAHHERNAADVFLDDARTAIRRIADERSRKDAELQYVRARLHLGDIEDARAFVPLISDPGTRATALTEVAGALADILAEAPEEEREPLHRKVNQLLAEIWSIGDWFQALDVVARVDPDMLADIATEAIALQSTDHRIDCGSIDRPTTIWET